MSCSAGGGNVLYGQLYASDLCISPRVNCTSSKSIKSGEAAIQHPGLYATDILSPNEKLHL